MEARKKNYFLSLSSSRTLSTPAKTPPPIAAVGLSFAATPVSNKSFAFDLPIWVGGKPPIATVWEKFRQEASTEQ